MRDFEEQHAEICVRVDGFVDSYMTGLDGWSEMSDFPPAVWQGLRESGLLGLSLPEEFGGIGGGYRALGVAARRLNERGGVMGVTLTWLCHCMNARLHMVRLGTAGQRARWLPKLASGETTLTLAISEPGVGAHPKHLKTTARLDGGDYVLNGEKAYLTNGPLAGLFVILAITDEDDGRKQFSAILVERDMPGFKRTPGIEIDFLKPSPHCGIALTDCRVPAGNLLGDIGNAMAEISIPMRTIEDALGTSAKAGAMAAQLRMLGQPPTDAAMADFGVLLAKTEALGLLADGLAATLDENRDEGGQDPARLSAQTAGFRELAKHLNVDIAAYMGTHDVTVPDKLTTLHRDLDKSLGIAASVHRIQAAKRAKTFLEHKDQL
jgi:alkylation response protein AidB-like acyl-CoA dehydrogenase